MSAYMIARIKVTDPSQYSEYLKHTPRVIDEHGGRFIARSAEVQTLEGETETRRVVVIEFPSVEAAEGFYNSDAYGLAKALREGAADGQFIIVDEMSDEAWQSALSASQELSFS